MIKLHTALCLTALAFVGMFGAHAIIVRADEFPPTEDQRKIYVAALTKYQKDERVFGVAKQEYIQLQTLGKLEVAVQTFRDVQASRIQTLITYYQTLDLMVSKADGMELSKKETILQKLRASITVYKELGATVASAEDRVALEATAKTFTDTQDDALSLSYESLALLRMSAMQSALDQLNVTIDLVKKQYETADDATKAAKQRGFDELTRRMDIVRDAIMKANEFHDRIAGENNYSDSSYSQLTSTLDVGYPELRQAENFLRELAGK